MTLLQNADKISVVGAVAIMASLAFVFWSIKCKKRQSNLDVGIFASAAIGAIWSLWILVEAILNIGNPPQHWRLYVVVLSSAWVYICCSKCYDLWPRKEPELGLQSPNAQVPQAPSAPSAIQLAQPPSPQIAQIDTQPREMRVD